MPCYEMIGYAETGEESRVEFYAPTDGAAISRAGTRAKRIKGPVDVARIWPAELGDLSWNDRYISTAAPSEFHEKGWRQERLV